MLREHREKDPEESGSQHTALLTPLGMLNATDMHVAVKSNGAEHIAVKELQEAKKLR